MFQEARPARERSVPMPSTHDGSSPTVPGGETETTIRFYTGRQPAATATGKGLDTVLNSHTRSVTDTRAPSSPAIPSLRGWSMSIAIFEAHLFPTL